MEARHIIAYAVGGLCALGGVALVTVGTAGGAVVAAGGAAIVLKALGITAIITGVGGGTAVAVDAPADQREERRLLERLENVVDRQRDLRHQLDEMEQRTQRERSEFEDVVAERRAESRGEVGHSANHAVTAGFFRSGDVSNMATANTSNRGGRHRAMRIQALLEDTRLEGLAIDEQMLGNEQALGQLLSDQDRFLRENQQNTHAQMQ